MNPVTAGSFQAVAFQMVVKGRFDYAVQGIAAVDALRQQASDRCGTSVTGSEWDDIGQISGFTYRCILESDKLLNLD